MTDTSGENIHIRRHRIPGRGSRYDIPLRDGHHLIIVVSQGEAEARKLHVLASEDDEQPAASVELSPGEATTIATLLSDMRIVIDDATEPPRGVQVETLSVGAGSAAVGQRPDELPIGDPDHARILAVIRDDTPELIESDVSQACRPGDRLVVAGRPPHVHSLRKYLE